MAYNEALLNRIREALVDVTNIDEKLMFGGICFMVDDKMCICVKQDEIMCRVGPNEYETALEKTGARPMIHGGKTMKGYVFVDADAIKNRKDFDYWIDRSLEYNKTAKSSKKKK
ncbi:MAG: TfoX family protein [Mucilaginibacter sp.]|jgi:TfoX/Sxy family transcriptional regulator of competence genes|nr:TfoX family protein [Mucilaginibacter sp.]